MANKTIENLDPRSPTTLVGTDLIEGQIAGGASYKTTLTEVKTYIGDPTFQYIMHVVFDDRTDILVSTGPSNALRYTFPFDYDLTKIRGTLYNVPTGTDIVMGIWKNGSTILNNDLQFQVGNGDTDTDPVPPVLIVNPTSFLDGDQFVIEVTQVGSITIGQGLRIHMYGNRV